MAAQASDCGLLTIYSAPLRFVRVFLRFVSHAITGVKNAKAIPAKSAPPPIYIILGGNIIISVFHGKILYWALKPIVFFWGGGKTPQKNVTPTRSLTVLACDGIMPASTSTDAVECSLWVYGHLHGFSFKGSTIFKNSKPVFSKN